MLDVRPLLPPTTTAPPQTTTTTTHTRAQPGFDSQAGPPPLIRRLEGRWRLQRRRRWLVGRTTAVVTTYHIHPLTYPLSPRAANRKSKPCMSLKSNQKGALGTANSPSANLTISISQKV